MWKTWDRVWDFCSDKKVLSNTTYFNPCQTLLPQELINVLYTVFILIPWTKGRALSRSYLVLSKTISQMSESWKFPFWKVKLEEVWICKKIGLLLKFHNIQWRTINLFCVVFTPQIKRRFSLRLCALFRWKCWGFGLLTWQDFRNWVKSYANLVPFLPIKCSHARTSKFV